MDLIIESGPFTCSPQLAAACWARVRSDRGGKNIFKVHRILLSWCVEVSRPQTIRSGLSAYPRLPCALPMYSVRAPQAKKSAEWHGMVWYGTAIPAIPGINRRTSIKSRLSISRVSGIGEIPATVGGGGGRQQGRGMNKWAKLDSYNNSGITSRTH